MTFKDIFKSSFLDKVDAVSPVDMVLTLALAFAIGMFIYLIYRKCYAGVMYSSGFGITLVALTMITSLVIMAVTSNVVVSLGMVGALSIVRFRTAIKDPMDIAFLFWAIAAGIVLSAGLIPLAIIGSLLIGVVLFAFSRHRSVASPYIVVLRCDGGESEQAALALLHRVSKRCSVKSKTVQKGGVELNVEIRLSGDDTGFINELAELPGVESAVLVSYNGDYMG